MSSSGIAGKIGAFGAGFFGALWIGGAAGTLAYKLVSLLVFGKWPDTSMTDLFPSLHDLSGIATDMPELTQALAWIGRADLLTTFAVVPLVCLLCCLTLVDRPVDIFSPRTERRAIQKKWTQPPTMFGRPRPGGTGRGQESAAPRTADPGA
ncbi:MAG: hypothetical protein ACOY4F_04565 [Thermodesulfobacteriota bacterium]